MESKPIRSNSEGKIFLPKGIFPLHPKENPEGSVPWEQFQRKFMALISQFQNQTY